MSKSFKELRKEIRARPGAAEEIEIGKRAILASMELAKLREQMDTTQVELAELMNVSQANVSRIERADNLYLSTLASYIAGVGGRLEINAVFGDRVIPLGAAEEKV